MISEGSTAELTPVDEGAHSSVEEITPELAATLLSFNHCNRSLRTPLVAKYARDMSSGHWHYTGDPVRFGEDGTLYDGQHRLSAVIRSGVSVPMMVVYGVKPEARDVIDTGARRTGADAARLRGETNASVLTSVARMILTEGDRLQVQASNAELMHVIDTDPHLRWVVSRGIAGLGSLRTKMTPAVLGYAYWRLHQVDTFATAEFFERLASLAELPSGSPILALNTRLSVMNARGARAREYRRELLSVVFLAWNAWRKGRTLSVIMATRRNGQVLVPEPK